MPLKVAVVGLGGIGNRHASIYQAHAACEVVAVSNPANFEGHEIKVVRCPVKKGEVHYHHALVWHGSHANTSGRPRRAIALHYMTQETRYVAGGEHVMKAYVEVSDGELLQGQYFPLAYHRNV